MTNVLAEPEFSGSEDARRAFRLLEERSMLDDLLSRSVVGSAVGGVHVIIGGEGAWEELRQCSIVLARYGTPGQINRYSRRSGTHAYVLRTIHLCRPLSFRITQ